MGERTFKIHAVPALKDNYIWVVSSGGQALVIDPGVAEPALHYLAQENLQIKAVLATHKHGDHTAGIQDLLAKFPGLPVYGPLQDQVPYVRYDVREGQVLQLQDFPSIQVLEIPGHTCGHVAYLMAENLFCGDTLFAGGCGRVFDGSYEALFASLQKLARLPENTQIYCGHEYTVANLKFALQVEPENEVLQARLKICEHMRAQDHITLPSSLKLELATNPFLRVNVATVRDRVAVQAGHALPTEFAVFKALREWKNSV